MFTSKDSFKLYQKVSDVRSYFQLFKQNIIKHLDQIETQIETIIFEHYQRDTFDQIYENIIENTDDTMVTDDEFSSIINTWNKVCYMQNNIYYCRFNDKLVDRIKKTLGNWEKIAKETFQIDQSIIPRFYNKSFEFIEEYKFQSIKIENYNQCIEQTQSQTHYCFALVGEKIDWIETSTIRFKFPKFVGDMGVGVCDLNILKEKNFRPQLNQTGNGAFVCFQDSYTINTEQNDLNWKTKGFRFGEPDVIEVEFEPAIRKVTWKKVNKPNEGYSVTLQQNRYDLYFCVIVKTAGARVEISDD